MQIAPFPTAAWNDATATPIEDIAEILRDSARLRQQRMDRIAISFQAAAMVLTGRANPTPPSDGNVTGWIIGLRRRYYRRIARKHRIRRR